MNDDVNGAMNSASCEKLQLHLDHSGILFDNPPQSTCEWQTSYCQ